MQYDLRINFDNSVLVLKYLDFVWLSGPFSFLTLWFQILPIIFCLLSFPYTIKFNSPEEKKIVSDCEFKKFSMKNLYSVDQQAS